MDLDSMKYAELQSLAKELGLKANMKMDKLVKSIKKHYQQEQNKEVDVKVTEENQEEKAASDGGLQGVAEEPAIEASRAVFVNTRRGRGIGTKRTITEVTAVVDAAQVDNGVAETKETKKRKTEDMEVGHSGTTDKQDGRKGRTSKVATGGNIPRLQRGQQKNKPTLKPITPNFKKLHEAHFSKMESIDSYIQRKTKQIDNYRSAVKELKSLADKTKQKQVEGTAKVQKATRASVFSPAPATNKAAEVRRRHTMQSAKKASPAKDAAFKPSVISTRRINVHFSEATYDNEHKRSMVKTPARRSSCVASSTPLKPSADRGTTSKTTTLSATKTPGPFVFTGNTSISTPGTQKKTKFDLKASLSKPLGYKPHAGKLKPFGEPKENMSANKSLVSVDSHRKMYKQQRVQTREERRNQQVVGRKQKKQDLLGARRGLVML